MLNRRFITAVAAPLLAGVMAASPTAAPLKVVTSTPDLANFATEVGGKNVTVRHIGEGYQDPHFIEPKPSFVLQLRNADLWAFVGLDLEIGWMPPLLDGARNPRIKMGAPGYLDVSRAVPLLDVPSGNIDRSQGDVHPLGNPHYWLDPENGRRIARLFQQRFTELDPQNASSYAANERAFEAKLNAAERAWQPQLAVIRGQPVVAWHTSWRYLADYTKMNIVGFMEPKPGVPPSPSHLAGLIQQIKRTGAKVIIMEPFYDKKTADFVASKTGIKVLILPPSVGGIKGLDDYVALMKYDIQKIASTLQ
jgi:zinc/manganese transport system substrate-binding protein